jgi:HD-GYP domain-containing protein (c-di-GMP phosphodiesterase class II)
MNIARRLVILFFSFGIAFSLFAQTGKESIAQALAAYETDSYEKAFSLISGGVSETGSEASLKKAAAEALSSICEREYEAKNYKNAYEGFRKALKYDPTNTKATQYFLKIRKERDVTKLQNEGATRTAQAPAASGGVLPAASAVPVTGTVAQASPGADLLSQKAQLQAMEDELRKASERMSGMENSVTSASNENQALKSQIDQQVKLIQSLIDTQQKSAAASNQNSGSLTARQTEQLRQEQAIMAQTMQILAKLAEQERGPVIIQSSEDVKLLAQSMANQQNQIASGNKVATWLLIAIFGFLAFLVAGAFVAVIIAARARKQRQAANAYNTVFMPELTTLSVEADRDPLAIGAPRAETQTPLIEFMGQEGQAAGSPGEVFIKGDLIKAERLKRMYEEVRSGNLSWDTVRSYIGELNSAIRSDILKVVEQKIDSGDLLSDEAVLPVLFPFLTDYDDFVREKAQLLAKRALIEDGRGKPSEDGAGADDDPFSLKNLLTIPQELDDLFKGQDQSLVTARLSRGIGKELGLSNDDCNLLYKAALAHDCGYLMLDKGRLQAIIAKQEITEDDFEYVKSHVVKGPSFFEGAKIPKAIKEAILSHHERNDGSGYPDGLKKESIPRFAKILGVAETFAALVSKRAYREKRDIQHALAIIQDGTRSKFDADIVAALSKVAVASGYKG